MTVEAAVEAIWEGWQRRAHYPPALRHRLGLDEAYQVQLGLLDRCVAAGEIHAGWKVGLTARAMQEQWGVPEPCFGFLLESGHRPSGAVFGMAELIGPGFENELCIGVGAPLAGPGVSAERARAAIASVAPALEIVEKRGEFTGDLPLAMADNAQQKAFVTGPAVELGALDLAGVICEVVVNSAVVDRATGAEVLGSPVHSIAWLARKLAQFGRRIEPGQRVMSGSFTRQYPIAAGDRVEARFAGVGAVTAGFR